MATTTNQTASPQTAPTLQLQKQLIPINEYAAQQGLSTGIVVECGKLGIVQIRKYKGKTFVVDVPLSPYRSPSDASEQPTGPISKSDYEKRISELVQKLVPDTPENAEENAKPEESINPGTISQQFKKMLRKSFEAKDSLNKATGNKIGQAENVPQPAQTGPSELLEIILDPATATDEQNIRTKDTPVEPAEITSETTAADEEIGPVENFFDPVQTSDMETIDITEEPPNLIDESVEIEETLEPIQTTENDSFQTGILTARAKSKRSWQVTAVISLALLFPALLVNLWFYMDRKIQRDRIDQAYVSIQKVYNDFTQARQHAETIQSQLDNSKAEIRGLQNELGTSRAEITTLQNQLNLARQDFETVQQRNAEAVNQLNEQIQNLTARISELTKKAQPKSDPSPQVIEETSVSPSPLVQLEMQEE